LLAVVALNYRYFFLSAVVAYRFLARLKWNWRDFSDFSHDFADIELSKRRAWDMARAICYKLYGEKLKREENARLRPVRLSFWAARTRICQILRYSVFVLWNLHISPWKHVSGPKSKIAIAVLTREMSKLL